MFTEQNGKQTLVETIADLAAKNQNSPKGSSEYIQNIYNDGSPETRAAIDNVLVAVCGGALEDVIRRTENINDGGDGDGDGDDYEICDACGKSEGFHTDGCPHLAKSITEFSGDPKDCPDPAYNPDHKDACGFCGYTTCDTETGNACDDALMESEEEEDYTLQLVTTVYGAKNPRAAAAQFLLNIRKRADFNVHVFAGETIPSGEGDDEPEEINLNDLGQSDFDQL